MSVSNFDIFKEHVTGRDSNLTTEIVLARERERESAREREREKEETVQQDPRHRVSRIGKWRRPGAVDATHCNLPRHSCSKERHPLPAPHVIYATNAYDADSIRVCATTTVRRTYIKDRVMDVHRAARVHVDSIGVGRFD